MEEKVVIIGGGLTGLSTAYHIALTCQTRQHACYIVVIDAAEELWDTGSGYNTGCINGAFPAGPKHELTEYSYNMLRQLSEDDEFRKYTSIQDHTVFEVTAEGEEKSPNVPGWANAGSNWKLKPQPKDGSSMMINQFGLRDWLVDRCKSFGVEIFRNTKVVGATLNDASRIQSIRFKSPSNEGEIKCQHVVFAAGAWTQRLIDELFPNSSIDLKAKTDGLSWMIIKNPDPASQHEQVTLLLEPILDHDALELAARNDGTIFVCNGPDARGLPGFESSGVFEPVHTSIERCRTLLHKYIKQLADGTASLEVIKQGLSYRPTNELDRPILAAIPKGKIVANLAEGDRVKKSGVYVNTGQAYYGITMSMGSGKAMSDLIFDIEPEIDLRAFDLPE